jgi:2-oxoglutarate ferredoxin oxidoreductase subunit alpha
MILADGLLGQMMEPVEFDFDPIDPKTLPVPDWALAQGKAENKVVKSYDLRPGKMEEFNFALEKVLDEIEANEVMYEEINCDDAELVLTGYGTAARACKSAMALARAEGMKVGVIRPITVWPFPKKAFSDLADKVKNFLVVEMSLGQYVEDVQLAVQGKAKIDLHKRPAGGLPTAEEVLELIKQILGKA